MKLPAIPILVFTLGLGIAVGACFAPHLGTIFTSASDDSSGTLSENGDSSGAVKINPSGTGGSLSPGSVNGVLSSFRNESNPFRQMKNLMAYVQSLSPGEIPTAVQQIQKNPRNDQYRALMFLIGRWVEVDLKGAQAAISTMHDPDVRRLLIGDVYSALAAQDPSNAINLAQGSPERDDALSAVLEQMAQHDPAQALALSLKTKPTHGIPFGTIFSQWADKDLGQATQTALQLPHDDDRNQAIRAIVNTLVKNDASSAVAWVGQLPQGAVENWARANLVAYWVDKDPEAAADYVQNLQQVSADDRSTMNALVVRSWSQSDPKAFAIWAKSLPPSPLRQGALESSIGLWAKNDPQAALAFLNTLPLDASTQDPMYREIASEWATSDPQTAAAWANQLPDGNARNACLLEVISQWANDEPAKATVYLQSLPNGPLRNEAFQTVGNVWGRVDPVGASTWLTQLPSGAARDAAVGSFTNQVVTSDPDAAYQWAESISDANARQGQVSAILQRWMQIDPSNAAIAVQKSSLSAEQKNSLLQSNH
jgi:hypothetical protein